MKTQDNRFHYTKSRQLEQVMALRAQMRDFTYSRHAHEEYSFGVTLAGRQDFFSGGTFHRSPPGTIIVFNPGEVHDGHSGTDDALRYRMLYIHPNRLEPMLASAGVRQSTDFRIADTLIRDAHMRRHILTLVNLVESQSDSKLQMECELFQLATRIARNYGYCPADRPARKADRLLLQAQRYIRAHLHEELSLDDISREANLSKYHFLRLFREQFGITPHQYILNCRINKAREALEAGEAPDNVAFDLGFSDLSHFNRRFKPVYGMTPRQYQQHFIDR